MNREDWNSITSRAFALGLSLAAVGFVGAATLDDGRAWFLRKSPSERDEIRESLRRFDMMLNVNEQRAARALDDRLRTLPEDERDDYLLVLRRYHNWLRSLPERDRDALAAMPVDARLKRIHELSGKYPPPVGASHSSLDFIQTGGTGAFEVAALCKIWLAVTPAERARIDGLAVGNRKDELLKKGRELKIARELRPTDFNEEHWIAEARAKIRELRGGAAGPKDWLSKIDGDFDQADAENPDGGPRPRAYVHRLAVNLYVQEHKLDHPVDPTRLAQFFDAVPPWIRSTFVAYSGDDVRRRLSLLYRILYPFPEEFRGLSAPGAEPVRKTPPPAIEPKNPPAAAPAARPAHQTPF